MRNLDPWRFVLACYAIVAVLLLIEGYRFGRVLAELDLPAIVVERTDPWPCISDPLIREACERLECVDRCGR